LITVSQPIALEASSPAAAMLVLKERISDSYPMVSTEQAYAVAQVEVMEPSQARQGADSLGSLLQQVGGDQFVLGNMLTLLKLGRAVRGTAFFVLHLSLLTLLDLER
jgi:hypothetical protein